LCDRAGRAQQPGQRREAHHGSSSTPPKALSSGAIDAPGYEQGLRVYCTIDPAMQRRPRRRRSGASRGLRLVGLIATRGEASNRSGQRPASRTTCKRRSLPSTGQVPVAVSASEPRRDQASRAEPPADEPEPARGFGPSRDASRAVAPEDGPNRQRRTESGQGFGPRRAEPQARRAATPKTASPPRPNRR